MLKQRLMWILWPAFVVAGMTEILVFAMVDPEDIHWFGNPLTLSRQGVYSCAFFLFWGLHSVSGSLITLLSASPFEVNRCPLPAHDRPDGCPKKIDSGCNEASNLDGCCGAPDCKSQ